MADELVNARLNEENQAEAERRIGDADLDAPYRPPVIAPEHAEKYNKWPAGGRTRTGGGGTRRHGAGPP
jgi:hypothetical protein